MLKKLFSKPLKLNIGESVLQVSSTDDFSFILSGRTAISTSKLSELFKLSADQLEEQSSQVSKIKDSLYSIVSHAVEDPDSIERSMRELKLTFFSQDHNWRDIIKALNDGDENINPLRNIALSNYMKYLSSMEETIAHIVKEKKQSVKNEKEEEGVEYGATWGPGRILDEPGEEQPIEDKLKRLPKDKPVKMQLRNGGYVDLRLATYECKLLAKDNIVQFIDHAAKKILTKGRHIIGRGLKSSIKIDADQKYVSREHLQVVVRDNLILELTDLSSYGTFVSDDYLIS